MTNPMQTRPTIVAPMPNVITEIIKSATKARDFTAIAYHIYE